MIDYDIPADEMAVSDAVRRELPAKALRPRLNRFLSSWRPHASQWKKRTVPLLAVVCAHQRLDERRIKGAALVIVAGRTEPGARISARIKKAKKMGAAYIIVIHPHVIRTDKVPDHARHCTAVFFILPWTGESPIGPLPKKLYALRSGPTPLPSH